MKEEQPLSLDQIKHLPESAVVGPIQRSKYEQIMSEGAFYSLGCKADLGGVRAERTLNGYNGSNIEVLPTASEGESSIFP